MFPHQTKIESLQGYETDPIYPKKPSTFHHKGSASNLLFSDLCERHGDRLIAYDIKTGELICNRCVFSRDQTMFQFTSTVARDVSQIIKSK